MARRVCLGKLPDGNYGLWISAPSVDVMTADPLNGNQLTFNSNWTDMVQVHAIGTGHATSITKVAWPTLPYIPFLEIRGTDGASSGRVYDDTFLSNKVGMGAASFVDGFFPTNSLGVTFDYIYIAYKIPVPSG